MRLRYIFLALIGLTVVGGLGGWELSRVGVHQGYSPEQPIAFPHKLHAGDNKVPCLHCHYAARTSRHAGIPPANVCMNCHNIVEKQTAEIEKLKEAVQQERPIRWVKIHNLPDFVYFNHSQHVQSGMACQTCHGPTPGKHYVLELFADRLGHIMHTVWKPSGCTTVGTRCLDSFCRFGGEASTVMASASTAKLPTAEFAFFRNGCCVRNVRNCA